VALGLPYPIGSFALTQVPGGAQVCPSATWCSGEVQPLPPCSLVSRGVQKNQKTDETEKTGKKK